MLHSFLRACDNKEYEGIHLPEALSWRIAKVAKRIQPAEKIIPPNTGIVESRAATVVLSQCNNMAANQVPSSGHGAV